MKKLRAEGWQCARVERWQMRPQAKFGVRIDVWGVGDILACAPPTQWKPTGSIALVQTFPMANWKAHIEKIKGIPEVAVWKAAGGMVIVHGWAFKPKDGVRGAKKTWQCREEIL